MNESDWQEIERSVKKMSAEDKLQFGAWFHLHQVNGTKDGIQKFVKTLKPDDAAASNAEAPRQKNETLRAAFLTFGLLAMLAVGALIYSKYSGDSAVPLGTGITGATQSKAKTTPSTQH